MNRFLAAKPVLFRLSEASRLPAEKKARLSEIIEERTSRLE